MDDIAVIIESALYSNLQLCVSPITIVNINYIITRLENQKKADIQRKKILKLVYVEDVGQTIITKASNSKFKDFEDAVQNYCAEAAGHKLIITRNTKDYKESKMSILTPKEYLASIRNR
jgi:predicted nucleic acid-binding protein